MNNHSKIFFWVVAGLLSSISNNVTADIFQYNAFLYGNNIEVGIGRDGAFGSDVRSPDIGRKAYGNQLGYISDPSGNRFQTSYHGDFFLPGIPEEGWGVMFDGKAYNNNSNQQGAEILGSLSDFQSNSSTQKVTWKGSIEGLEITQVYRIFIQGTAIVFDVTLKNTTDTVMNNVYYMRTVDPDNNASQDPDIGVSKYVTTNTIVSQGSDESGISSITASQEAKEGLFTRSLLSLSGYGINSRVTYGGQFNRNPEEVYSGSDLLSQSGSNTADEAISLSFKFDQIKPQDSVTFRAGYQLKDIPTPIIDIDTDDSSGGAGNEFKQLYILGSAASKITDNDISIKGDGFTQLIQAIITLTNPHSGDKLGISGNLPSGITLNSTETSDTEIRIQGLASVENYKSALKEIVFSNTDTHSQIDTRFITIQVIDDNSTPSNTATSIVNVTTPVTLDKPKIADDDVVSHSEIDHVLLSGHAAPDATMKIEFTDSDGVQLTPFIGTTADKNGNWNIDSNPADLSSLGEGEITVVVSATDPNGNISSLTKQILKDTIVTLSNVSPADNETVSSMTPVFQGKSDAIARITLKILPEGKTYTSSADAHGDWRIQLDKMPMGVTIAVLITAEDTYENKISATLHFLTPNLPIDITDLDVDAQGVAHSTMPTIQGTSNPETNISIEMPTKNDQITSCSTATDSDGNWRCKLPASPAGGPYTLTAITTDNDGNTNATTRQITIPELSLTVDSPIDGEHVSSTSPIFIGITEANVGIELKILPDGKNYKTTADAEGNWTIRLEQQAKGKNISVEVTAIDAAENKARVRLTIQTPILPVEIISLDTNEQGVANSTTPTIIGTSDADTSISIDMPVGNGQSITCSTTTDSSGNWHCKLPISPSGGPYTLTVTSTDNEGNSNSTSKPLFIPELPLIIHKPVNNAIISGVKPIVDGTSQPNTNIMVLVSSGERCTAITDDSNHWRCQLPTLAFDKHYTITVSTEDSIGNNTSKSIEIYTDRLPLAVIAPQNNSTTDDTTPLFIGTTTPNTSVTVTAETGQECTTTADSTGRWSCELSSMPVGGPYYIVIKAVDTHGNQATLTENITIPAIPLIIITPADGDLITETHVTVTGSSDPNTSIKVLGADGESCETNSDANGDWSCQLDNLQSGTNKFITVISGDGNSQKVAIVTVNIENSSEGVKTILAGNTSPLTLFLLSLFLLLKHMKKGVRSIRNY